MKKNKIKLTDKDYTRNLHYHFKKSDKQYYEGLEDWEKEHTLFKMIEHYERLLMLYYEQGQSITSLEQLVDDLHIVRGVDKTHPHHKDISECIELLHKLNSWYEEIKTKDEFVLSGDEDE